MRPYENSGWAIRTGITSDLYRYLKSRKYSDEVLRETGLFTRMKKRGCTINSGTGLSTPLWTPTAASSVSEARHGRRKAQISEFSGNKDF